VNLNNGKDNMQKVRIKMEKYEITAEFKIKPFISEVKEVIQALTEFVDKLEQIDLKYSNKAESEDADERG
jgi:cupin superfamily acireductone dioxygenase involved in methionine salvage